MEPVFILLIVVILIIIGIQILFSFQNYRRSRDFKNIFAHDESWRLKKDSPTNSIVVEGEGNSIFLEIVSSINIYLKKIAVEIDFGAVKESVDSHCDTVENDISTQTPIPLYCGLAGTMIGVIIGLLYCIPSIRDILKTTLDAKIQDTDINITGILDLLKGVAIAMTASFFGLLFTTINIRYFKRCKLEEEIGKAKFLEWLQSNVRANFPSDTTEAFNNLVNYLQEFNTTFSENTSKFREVLAELSLSAGVIKSLDENALKNADANILVLKELQKCTNKLSQFNQYLDSINGYTDAIHRFESQFQAEADRIHILTEIRDFFREYKGSIAKTTADADSAIKDALASIQDSTSNSLGELQKDFLKLNAEFKDIVSAEQDSFAQLVKDYRTGFKTAMDEEKEYLQQEAKQLRTEYSTQLSQQLPQITRQVDALSAIPNSIDSLIERLEKSNDSLAATIKDSNEKLANSIRRGARGFQWPWRRSSDNGQTEEKLRKAHSDEATANN